MDERVLDLLKFTDAVMWVYRPSLSERPEAGAFEGQPRGSLRR
jgi:hypothetical protein